MAGLSYGDTSLLLLAALVELRRRREATKGFELLTAAERDVMRLLGEGFSPKQIATETSRALSTVRAHIANSVAKLECHGRFEALERARQHGLI